MKIVDWNCGGAFRKKIEPIKKYDADIYIIQECEHPDKFIERSVLKSFNFHWKGSNQNKGLAIFSKPEIKIKVLELDESYRNRQLKWFLPVTIEDNFDLVAVWTHKAEAEAFAYIGQFYWYLENNLSKIKRPVFIGDFNSNSIWDSWDRWWNHSDIVEILENRDIKSLYHNCMNEKQGSESLKTFHHRKDLEKGYHIDYIFADDTLLKKTLQFYCGDPKEWLEYSDHVPLVWTFTPSSKKNGV
ncbi:MAG: endonuclease/exonuclease/phosphatase family protein [Spirochaetes bacterium]|nr:endonuclease/exonuclease/phosphatase family protein [Spirochaetota bacterium]MBN2772539.1 endonuclease/exonuclease/phosphatase family protein [Spirochaetota bacterium]